MSYKSPIEVFQTQLRTEMDGEILKAVHEVGVLVDKDELLKALKYDREQYIKGYDDCWNEYSDAISKSIQKKPVLIDTFDYLWKCPTCGRGWDCDTQYGFENDDFKYCPYCGQKIDWSEE